MKHATRNKALSWILTLALLLGLLPGMAGTAKAAPSGQAWSRSNSLPNTSGTYYLTQDVTITGTWRIGGTGYVPGGPFSITLDLNGHGIRFDHNKNLGSVIFVGRDCSLTINDSAPTTVHYITLSEPNGYGKSVSSSGTESSTCIKVNGGYITGGYHNIEGCGGAGVELHSGTFIMNGGTICGNKSCDSGGGVQMTYGTFIMNGGTIKNNTTERGGGVSIWGTFTMTGGTITKNAVITSYSP